MIECTISGSVPQQDRFKNTLCFISRVAADSARSFPCARRVTKDQGPLVQISKSGICMDLCLLSSGGLGTTFHVASAQPVTYASTQHVSVVRLPGLPCQVVVGSVIFTSEGIAKPLHSAQRRTRCPVEGVGHLGCFSSWTESFWQCFRFFRSSGTKAFITLPRSSELCLSS